MSAKPENRSESTPEDSTDRPAADIVIEVFPYRAMSARMMWALVAIFAVLSLTMATVFAVLGAWMVLPFAGLEILALAIALYWFGLRSRDGERIRLTGDRVEIASLRGKQERTEVFQRYWAQVRLDRDPDGWYDSKLRMGSHGRFVEIGTQLSDEERLALFGHLRTLIR